MRILEYLKIYRREFFYSLLIFVAWQLSLIPKQYGQIELFFWLILTGLLTVSIWIIGSFLRYRDLSVTRFSEAILKAKLRKRFSIYVTIPLILYMATSVYLLVSKSLLLSQMTIILVFIINCVLFINIRGSYARDSGITRNSRGIFNFIDIILFYLILASVVFLGVGIRVETLIAIPISFLLLLHQLIIHRQDNMYGISILLVSVIFIGIFSIAFASTNRLLYPLFMTNIFYLVVSWWNIRLDGSVKVDDYLLPLIFTLMSSMVLFNF